MNLKVRRMVTKFYVISNEANEKLKQFHYWKMRNLLQNTT
jgi:hypothetical protein